MKDQQSRRWFGFLGACLVVAAFAGSAIAAVQLKTWGATDTLTANDLNGNFKALADAVTALETKHASPYLGKTVAKSGAAGGYAGVKALCVAATGNADARACTAHDIVVAASAGQQLDEGWYASGAYDAYPVAGSDCVGFSDGTSSYRGASWSSALAAPSHAYCSASLPFLCCR